MSTLYIQSNHTLALLWLRLRPIVLFRHFSWDQSCYFDTFVKPIVLFRQFPRNQSCYFDNFRETNRVISTISVCQWNIFAESMNTFVGFPLCWLWFPDTEHRNYRLVTGQTWLGWSTLTSVGSFKTSS